MRLGFAAIIIATLPAVAAAQVTSRRGHVAPTPPPPSISGSLPAIGLPLPPIGLPLPSLGLPPANVAPPVITRGRHRPGRPVYFVPVFDWYYGYPMLPGAPAAAEPPPPVAITGTLRFDVQPEKLLQIFIDGYYVGTPDDFGSELELDAGTHSVELTAPGHESVKFQVKIDGTRPITYRGTLKPLEAKPETAVPPPAAPPSTLYYIPGCYLGNVDPATVTLPAGCDMSKLVSKPSGAPR